MKLKYILSLIVLLAMVSAIYAKSDLFKKKISVPPASTVYVSMAHPAQLDGVKAFDVLTGAYVIGKLNSDKLWELNLDPSHRYHIEVFYNNAQGAFNSVNFAGATKRLKSGSGSQWYRVTKKAAVFSDGSSYVLYSCQGTNCFE